MPTQLDQQGVELQDLADAVREATRRAQMHLAEDLYATGGRAIVGGATVQSLLMTIGTQ